MSKPLIGDDATLHFIVKIHDRLMANLHSEYKSAGLGALSPSHAGILARLYPEQTLTMRELAFATNRDKSTVTALCQKLDALGMIQRSGDPHDLRLARASLTEAGKKAALKVRRATRKQIVTLHRGLSDTDRAMLNPLLQKWLQAMEAVD